MEVIVYIMYTFPPVKVEYNNNFQSAVNSNIVEECCADSALVLSTM